MIVGDAKVMSLNWRVVHQSHPIAEDLFKYVIKINLQKMNSYFFYNITIIIIFLGGIYIEFSISFLKAIFNYT